MPTCSEIHLVKRPRAVVDESDFALARAELPDLGEGQVLVRVLWLSIDPYLNELATSSRMRPMVPLGACMPGRGIAEVVAGPMPAGTLVSGEFGWREMAVVPANALTPVPAGAPPTWSLSALGTPGLAAWIGLHEVLQAQAGQVLLVSSAAGAVGAIAGQLARAAGLQVIGIASGPGKCAWLREAGFSAAIDRLQVENWPDALASAAPQGLDLYFDNTGGQILEAAVRSLNPGGAALLCGHSSEYTGPPARLPASAILYKRLKVQGFLVWDHAHRFAAARSGLQAAVARGELQLKETVHEGLASAPRALCDLLRGRGAGKHLVKVAPAAAQGVQE